jgi:hypothetical protein
VGSSKRWRAVAPLDMFATGKNGSITSPCPKIWSNAEHE